MIEEQVASPDTERLLILHHELAKLLTAYVCLSQAQSSVESMDDLHAVLDRKQLILDELAQRNPGTLFAETELMRTTLHAAGAVDAARGLDAAMRTNYARFTEAQIAEDSARIAMDARRTALLQALETTIQQQRIRKHYQDGAAKATPRFLDGHR